MPHYDYNKNYPFAAFITNLGKYNEGALVGEWVKFPTTAEELKKVFERIGIGAKDDFGQTYEEWFITDYDCYVDGLYDLLGEYANLDELNYLASKLDDMSQDEYERFQAAMEIGNHTGSIQELINLTENLDCYDVYPDIHDHDDLGRYYIEELDAISNLISIADEIFGERNRLAILVWKKKYTGGKGSSTFVDYHEYILAYARNIEQLGDISMARPEEEKGKFVNTDAYFAERGKYYTRPLKSNLDPRPTLVYPIVLPDGSSVTTQWICAKDTYEQLKAEGRIEFKDPKSSKFPVYRKYYENDAGGTVKIPSFIEVSNNNAAKEELKSLLNVSQTRDLPFQTPKPTELLQLFVQNFTSGNDYILDFFSGSASTAHAVLNANICDNKKRHFIMVQLPEANGLRGATYKNICEIGKERIRRAGDKIKTEHPDADLDIGFRVFRVDSSNMRDVYYKPEEFTQTMLGEAVSNIKPDRTDLDLLYACLLDCGVPIHLPHTTTTVDGCTIHNVDNGALMACFDEHIPHSVIRAMAAEAPLQVIFRDSAFAADADKINVTEIFKNLSPDTKVRVI